MGFGLVGTLAKKKELVKIPHVGIVEMLCPVAYAVQPVRSDDEPCFLANLLDDILGRRAANVGETAGQRPTPIAFFFHEENLIFLDDGAAHIHLGCHVPRREIRYEVCNPLQGDATNMGDHFVGDFRDLPIPILVKLAGREMHPIRCDRL
jgi:hypothetical protein